MDILFIVDPLASFNLQKDSSYAMMRAAATQGHGIWVCHSADLSWHNHTRVQADCQQIELIELSQLTRDISTKETLWYQIQSEQKREICTFDRVLMRTDPPFDAEYFYATHLLSQAEREGAQVFNRPRALREHPEKLALLEFPQFTPPTLVTRNAAEIRDFHAQHGDIILKPLDGMGGMGVFRVKSDGLNLGVICETLNRHGAQSVMVQRFIPAISEGDKRILLIDGHAVPYCLARIPQGTEVRGNLAAGGKGKAQALTPRDQAIAQEIGPRLAQRGLFLIGLDVIGDYLTEINVTSPTCFQEIHAQTGHDVAAQFITALVSPLHAAN